MRIFIIIVVILGVIFYFLGQRTSVQTSTPAATTPSAYMATPAPPAPAAAAPRPAATPVNNQLFARMQAAARKVGVELRQFTPQPPSGAMAAIAWTGDNMALGGDFLDECRKQGIIRDFDINNKREGMTMENGRRVFTAQYLVFF